MKKAQQLPLLATLLGVAFFVYGASGHSVRMGFSDSDRINLAIGAVLIVGGGWIYKYGWPTE